jgi:hypothetical protein
MEIYDKLKEYEDIALSDKQVLELVNGRANIVLYPNLLNYKSIDELLYPYGACFLLFEAQPRYGHWCCITKHGNTIEFFNPYGGYPDDSLKFISDEYRKISNQDYPYLSMLLLNSPYELTYNEFKFQRKHNDTKTCGRWCAVRILTKHIDLYNFHKIFKDDGDMKVTLLTMYINIK